MSDLERQLRAYAEQIDAAAPPVEELASPERHPSADVVELRRRTPAWVILSGAAALVAVVVMSAALLGTFREPIVETATSTIPTSSSPPSTITTTVPPDLAPSAYVTLRSDAPAYAGGIEGDVGGHPMADAGPVVVVDGVHHTLFAAGGDDEKWEAVYHATSTDGLTWDVDPAPVVFPGIRGAADLYIGSLMQLDDGTWVVYYHIAFDVGGHGNHIYEYTLGRATAAAPEGPWVVDAGPVLVPGAAGEWDASAVRSPSVIRNGDSWLMFYTGSIKEPKDGEPMPEGVVGSSALGLATSRDGITWTKVEGPLFTGDPNSAWEEGAVSRTNVVWDGGRYLLLYAGRTGGSRGLAVSGDGLVWDRVESGPVLTSLDLPRPTIFSTAMYVLDGDVVVHVANGGQRTTSAVYVMDLDAP